MGVRYVSSRSELGRPDMIILPGTKNTMGDLRWLRESGLEGQILRLASADTPVLGVCGGFQMLGKAISDPCGVEEGGEIAGMGLLPVKTSFSGEKMRTRVRASVVAGPFAGAVLSAYEIHMGRTIAEEGTEPFAETEPESPKKESAGYVDGAYAGNVFGTYLHGLFDSGELTERLAEYLCTRRGIDTAAYKPESRAAYRERQYEKLAKCVRESLDLERVYRIIFEGRN